MEQEDSGSGSGSGGRFRRKPRPYVSDEAAALRVPPNSLEAEQAGIETFTLDVLKQDEVDAAAKRVGTPDILFNCSGYVHAGTLMDTDDKAWDFSFDLNVKAHFRMMKAFMPAWLARGKTS